MKPVAIELAVKGKAPQTIDWDKPFNGTGINVAGTIKKSQGISRLTVSISSRDEIELAGCSLILEESYDPAATILCNGYQSWSRTEELPLDSTIKPLLFPLITKKRYRLDRLGEEHFYPLNGKEGELHSHTWTFIRQSDGSVLFLGSLVSDEYTVFVHDTAAGICRVGALCQGRKLSAKKNIIDFVIIQGSEEQAFSRYAKELGVKALKKPVTGWTSWYNYYTGITEKIILANLKAYRDAKIKIDVFQIDDGYQTAVGDWLCVKDTFPSGMAPVAAMIHKAGMKAGLWLAPFGCANNSRLLAEHPDWIVRDERGKMVEAGFIPNWGGVYYALDIYNPAFVAYLKEVFAVVFNKWKFDLVKLDFLYAAAMIPRAGKSRGMIMHDAMALLRKLCGKKEILACGIPLGQAPGLVEYCRIGSDVHLAWEDQTLKFINYRERVSTINSLKSTLHRYQANGKLFINDPDVFILRQENNSLAPRERKTLFLLNVILGGLVFTSDDISHYDEKTMTLYRSMFPHRRKEKITVRTRGDFYAITFSIGTNDYLCYANCNDHKDWKFPVTGMAYDNGLISGRERFLKKGDTIFLEPHESVVLLADPRFSSLTDRERKKLFPGS